MSLHQLLLQNVWTFLTGVWSRPVSEFQMSSSRSKCFLNMVLCVLEVCRYNTLDEVFQVFAARENVMFDNEIERKDPKCFTKYMQDLNFHRQDKTMKHQIIERWVSASLAKNTKHQSFGKTNLLRMPALSYRSAKMVPPGIIKFKLYVRQAG